MLRVLSVLIRFLAVLLLARLVLQAVAAFFRGPKRPAAAPPGAAARLVRDSVCNTFLPQERALTAVVSGREQHFCSPACRDQALAAAR